MSLTSHLDCRDSPVRAFFAEHLGSTSPVVREAATSLRNAREVPALPTTPGVAAGRAGTAVDYLLRFALARDPGVRYGAGHRGAGMLGRDLSISALVAIEDAMAFVEAAAPFERRVTDDEWLELTQISLLLATFEAVYRTAGSLPACLTTLATVPPDLDAWTRLVCTDFDVEDVAVLGWAGAEDHEDLRGRTLRCNPTFAQSAALGGADGDLLTDRGVLLDFKSTGTTRVCSATDVWQLCGYALADTDDELAITAVGLSALRWRTRVVWPLGELLESLTGSAVDLASLRHDFAAALSKTPRPRRTAGPPRSLTARPK